MYETTLKNVPHRLFIDLAVIYVVDMHDRVGIVTNKTMETYGVDEEILYHIAVENLKPKLENLSSMVGLSDESPLWVGTVANGVHGAACILSLDFMKQVTKKIGNRLFILPSSTHEVLFVQDDGSFDTGALEDTVRSVNAAYVNESDFLSNSVYRYDDGKWSVARAVLDRICITRENIDAFLGFSEGL